MDDGSLFFVILLFIGAASFCINSYELFTDKHRFPNQQKNLLLALHLGIPIIIVVITKVTFDYPILGGFVFGIPTSGIFVALTKARLSSKLEEKRKAEAEAQEERERAEKAEQFEEFFDDVEDDDGFSHDKETFNNKSKAGAAQPSPHRTDRHPDDLKLWAVVDDPSFSEGERKNAFDMILRKQAKRNSGTGKDVAKT